MSEFSEGQVVGERYRIVRVLGRGQHDGGRDPLTDGSHGVGMSAGVDRHEDDARLRAADEVPQHLGAGGTHDERDRTRRERGGPQAMRGCIPEVRELSKGQGRTVDDRGDTIGHPTRGVGDHGRHGQLISRHRTWEGTESGSVGTWFSPRRTWYLRD